LVFQRCNRCNRGVNRLVEPYIPRLPADFIYSFEPRQRCNRHRIRGVTPLEISSHRLSFELGNIAAAGPAALLRSRMGISNTARGRARQARTIDGEILRMIAGKGDLVSLTAAELDFDRHPVTRPALAIPVSAWVRFGDHPVRVDAEVVGWTDNAAAVRFVVPNLGLGRCWLWASAVSSR